MDRTESATGKGSAKGSGSTAPGADRGGDALARRIDRAARRARWALAWERAWPRLAWSVGVVVLFLALSWAGLWTMVPDPVRLVLVALFVVGFAAALVPLRGFRRPSRQEALLRVERENDLPHRPLESYEDTVAEGADPVARALWTAHRERIARSVATLRTGLPHPDLPRTDRYGLRVVLGLLLFVGVFAGAGEYRERVAAAFRGAAVPVALDSRVDAWVTPPAYTGRAPLFLTGDNRVPVEKDGTIRVPQGSVLVVRTSPPSAEKIAAPTAVTLTSGGVSSAAALKTDGEPGKPVEPQAKDAAGKDAPAGKAAGAEAAARPGQPVEREAVLARSATVAVTSGGRAIGNWSFVVEPDLAPKIRLIGEPEVQLSGAVKLVYEVQDDYGVVAAEARIEPAGGGPDSAAKARPLIGAPDFPLALPQGRMRSGQAQVFRDLTSHPWSGGPVRLTLVARDEAGQEGRSETVEVDLPAKPFRKPLARALVEQRRTLAMDAEKAPLVATAIDALTLGAEHFADRSGPYFGMRMAYRSLVGASSDDELRDVVDLLWTIALSIEDGDLSLAEKALRDAQDALRKALDNNASDQEIARLTQELRKALDRYLSELAMRQRQNPQARSPMDPNARTMRKQDLDKMLDRIENLSKTGSKDAARQLLAEMQQMLENLQAGQQGGQQGEQGEQSDALDKLGEMIQRQQQLMDKTHRLDRRGGTDRDRRRPGQPGDQGDQGQMSEEELKQALQDLQKNQSELQQALKELREKMGKGEPRGRADRGKGDKGQGEKGQDKAQGDGQPGQGKQAGKGKAQGRPGERGEGGQAGEGEEGDQLGQAEGAMGEARDALGEGEAGDAVDAQGRALDALRQGARQLADQMMQQQQGRQPGGMQAGEQQGNEDPLGRPNRTGAVDPGKNLVPGEIDVQRARRVLEDIRRRLSDPSRPRIELDYLERLLQLR